MGFMSAMKGANNSWGMATGSCINGVGYIGPEKMVNNTDQKLMVSCASMKETIVFGKGDVEKVEMICATSEWVKYRIALKDGKVIIASLLAIENGQRGKQISMNLLNFEWWLADVLYK